MQVKEENPQGLYIPYKLFCLIFWLRISEKISETVILLKALDLLWNLSLFNEHDYIFPYDWSEL